MSFFLRVITLNCWALPQPWPIGSKHRKYRLEKLVEALSESDYDVVSLQEIWSEADFLFIDDALKPVFPFSHYFHSGFTGSGVCVFSKYPIVSTLMHRYSLNGFAHHVHRGDWFGGKVVGLVLLSIGDVQVSFYTTHLHAEYNRENDLFLPHRLSQAFELSQFVKHTESSSDCSVLTGDFNIEPEDLGYRLILNNAHLRDSWLERPCCNKSCSGMTCDRPDNCYTVKSALKDAPNGKRLDYIMFKSGKAKLRLVECENRLGKIPGSKDIDYSDHLGVYSKFEIIPESASSSTTDSESEKRERDFAILNESLKILGEGEMRALWDRRLFLAGCVILLALIVATLAVEVHFSYFTVFATIARFFLTLILAFCVWYGCIGLTMELKALKASKLSMQQLLNE